MTEKELQDVRKIVLKKNELKKKQQRILELKKEPKVKEYIELINHLDKELQNEKIIVIDENQSNKLLFDYGRYSIKLDGYDVSVCLYRDLETTQYFYYTPFYTYQKLNGFCLSYCSEKKELNNQHYKFNKVREYFFEQLLNKSQEEVVDEMLENNKQLVKGKGKQFWL